MFKDPKTANARIYVGNVAETINKNDLENLFQKHGNIQGVLHQKKFAFIQFTNEAEATRAVDEENGTMLKNRKLMVRFAQSKVGGNQERGGPGNQQMGGNQMQNQNQPMGGMGMGGRNNNNNNNNQGGGGGGNWNNNRDRSRSPMSDGRNNWKQNRNNSGNFNSNNNIGNNNNNNNRNSGGFFGGPQEMGGNNSNFGDNNMPQQNFQHPDYNDCEIIVVSKALTNYAELVEQQLKRLDLTVDLLFPNDDVPIGKVLANIASRGSLYGLLVTPQNEQHRSITVTQLYGDNPVEHRNMPVEEAVKYIYRDFQKKTNSNGPPNPQFPTAIQFNTIVQTPELKEAHPEPIQILLNMLAENRALTVLQYERVLKYLTERKEMQIKAEIGDDLPPTEVNNLTSNVVAKEPPKVDPEAAKEEELQKKILEILNKPSLTETIKKVEEPKPKIPPFKVASASSTSTSTPATTSDPGQSKLLKDEKVQKALDFLLLGKKF